MIIIPPVEITDAILSATNIPEPDTGNGDPAEWLIGTTYAADDEVTVSTDHLIYVSVQAGNTGNDPSTDDGTWWIEKQATNGWAMFDDKVNTQTSNASGTENLLTFPEAFNNVAWTKSGSSISADATTDPTGTTTADKLVENGMASTHYVQQDFSTTSGEKYTNSIFVKADERDVLTVIMGTAAFGANVEVDFDLTAVTATINVSGTNTSVTITDEGNGWYRCSVTSEATASTTATNQYLLNNGTGTSYTGDSSSGLFLWGALIEETPVLLPYYTSGVGRIDVTFDPGEIISGLAILNITGSYVRVIMEDATEGVVYDEAVSLVSNSGVADWYAYYFTPIERDTSMVLTDLPAYGSATLRVIIDNESAQVAVGALKFGYRETIGTALFGTTAGIINYDRKTTDSFGNTTILSVAFSKRAEFDVLVETRRTAFIQNLLAATRGTPVIWVGYEDYGATVVYGFFRDFSIILNDTENSSCSIQVEGLI